MVKERLMHDRSAAPAGGIAVDWGRMNGLLTSHGSESAGERSGLLWPESGMVEVEWVEVVEVQAVCRQVVVGCAVSCSEAD